MARHSLKYNAAVLSITGFIVKVIGFFYRIFIANSIGSEGLGLYQLVTPIYALLVLVLSAGISVTVSRFVAEETSEGREYKGVKIVTVAASMALVAGIIVCGILLFNLDLILGFTGDARTRSSIYWILLLVPPIASASAFKGYFYGKEEMIPNAIGQISEQVAKLATVLALFNSFKGHGVENMCLLAVIAMLVGECVNVSVVYIAFLIVKRKRSSMQSKDEEKTKVVIKRIAKAALPLSANRLVLSFINMVENMIIPKRLTLSGLTFQGSLMEFGKLSGMASPLVFFPSMLPGALATALVPAIASAVACRQYSVANRQISQSIRITIVMGFIFTSLFACSSREIAELVYPGAGVGKILHLLSFTGVFLYLQQTMLGILNGLGREKTILRNTLAGSIIRLAAIWFGMPILGVDAYIYGVIAGSVVGVILNFMEISRKTGMSFDMGEWILKPLSAALIGSCISLVIKKYFFLDLSSKISMLVFTIITLVTISTVFFLTGVIKFKDLKRWSGRNKV